MNVGGLAFWRLRAVLLTATVSVIALSVAIQAHAQTAAAPQSQATGSISGFVYDPIGNTVEDLPVYLEGAPNENPSTCRYGAGRTSWVSSGSTECCRVGISWRRERTSQSQCL